MKNVVALQFTTNKNEINHRENLVIHLRSLSYLHVILVIVTKKWIAFGNMQLLVDAYL